MINLIGIGISSIFQSLEITQNLGSSFVFHIVHQSWVLIISQKYLSQDHLQSTPIAVNLVQVLIFSYKTQESLSTVFVAWSIFLLYIKTVSGKHADAGAISKM